MSQRGRGKRIWDNDPEHTLPQIKPQPQKKRSKTYRVTDYANGWYFVTDGEDEWTVALGTDGKLAVEERTYPNKRCDPMVIKAVKNYL